MKKIVEIVPAPPGWYSRWRLTGDQSMTYPVQYAFQPPGTGVPDDICNPVDAPAGPVR